MYQKKEELVYLKIYYSLANLFGMDILAPLFLSFAERGLEQMCAFIRSF